MDAVPFPTRLTLPAGLIWYGAVPFVTFREVAITDLAAPFVDDALARGKVVALEPLDAFDRDLGDLRLIGAIHHMTRCGSTLLRRQFDVLPGVMALSEPFHFQHLIEGPCAPSSVTLRRIRQLVAAWRDGVAPVANRLVIKWPSLLAQHAALLAAALPEVPMVFLHRDPHAVLASIAAAPLGGGDAVRPHHLFAPDVVGTVPRDALRMWAMLIARNCHAAAGISGLCTLDYAQLPMAAWEACAPYFGVSPSAGSSAAMRGAARFHAKGAAGAVYVSRPMAHRSRDDSELRALASDIVAPALGALLRRTPPLIPQSAPAQGRAA